MEKIVLNIKDSRRLHFLLELLNQFDFVEVEKSTSEKEVKSKTYDLFASAGIWENRDIESKNLREKAWNRTH